MILELLLFIIIVVISYFTYGLPFFFIALNEVSTDDTVTFAVLLGIIFFVIKVAHDLSKIKEKLK